MKYIYITLVIFCSAILSCQIKKNLVLVELVKEGFNNRDSDSLIKIVNSLNKLSDSTRYILMSDDSIDVDKENMVLKFSELNLKNITPRDLYTYTLCVQKKDMIYQNHDEIEIDDLDNSLKEYLTQGSLLKDNTNKLFETTIQNLLFEIHLDNYGDKNFSVKDWKNAFDIINIINQAFDANRNNLSIEYFGSTFNDLPISIKCDIMKKMPKSIVFIIGSSCYKNSQQNPELNKESIYEIIE